jgi:meiotic recombination protein SPO11
MIASLVKKISYLLNSGQYETLRNIYYQDVSLYGSQTAVNQIVNEIACSLGIKRHELHILASSKGLVKGQLTFFLRDGSTISASGNVDLFYSGCIDPKRISNCKNSM